VVALRAMFRVSERFACRVVGQHRSTQRHAGKVVDIEEAKLRRRLREIAAEHLTDGHISSETVMQSPSRPSSESVVVVQFARTKAFSAVA
jgi:hypothetical protein